MKVTTGRHQPARRARKEAAVFTYPFTSEIGAGDIPRDLQDALWREINERLGEAEAPAHGGDERGPLTRLEKSLILIRISAALLNSMRTHLHCLAALKAGATLDQVAEACLSVITVGMLRWKMASMDSLSSAEAWAKRRKLPPRTPPAPEKGMEKRIEEIREYIRQALGREFPDMWERLVQVAPFALDGYMRIRGGILRSGGAIPKRIKELMVVGSDIVQGNAWGAGMHAGQAVRDGATVAQVVDTVALTMMELGQSAYRIGGMDAIQGAREAAARARAR